jgi:hypothetical protein
MNATNRNPYSLYGKELIPTTFNPKICSIPNCKEVVTEKGLCHTHYNRYWIYAKRETLPKFISKTEKRLNKKYNDMTLKDYNRRIKIAVIEHYGNRCVCCGETKLPFLTLSHKNDDGWKHRKEINSGGNELYRKLIRDNFQTEYELQVECFNCNLSKRSNNGICPHKI